jgi:2-polyprenyl-3-methyl-5-hydroxy-6-metoxy-1,4-benzoquinol methylase
MIYRERCPITGEHAEVIFSRPYQLPQLRAIVDDEEVAQAVADKDYEIRYCATSDLYFQSWVFDEAEVAHYYSKGSDTATILRSIAEQKLHWFAHMAEEILVVRQVCNKTPPVVLDFGTNWGKWASMALAHGCDVYGVEVNLAAESFCASRGIKMIKLDQLGNTPMFDFINIDQVVEHLSDPLGVIARLKENLKPDGIIKISVPGSDRLPVLLREAQTSGDNTVLKARTLKALAPLGHVNLFTNKSLRALGKQLGLEPMRPPIAAWLGAGQMWNMPRQINRNLLVPFKRYFQRGTYLWFRQG